MKLPDTSEAISLVLTTVTFYMIFVNGTVAKNENIAINVREVAQEQAINVFDRVRDIPVEERREYCVAGLEQCDYPEAEADRYNYILEYISNKYPELSNTEVTNLTNISDKENGNHDPIKTPSTWVKHCKRDDGTYYAVELSDCANEVHREKSIGIFQILPSTWKGYKCEGNIENVDNQIDCGVKIYKASGLHPWYNSASKLKLI